MHIRNYCPGWKGCQASSMSVSPLSHVLLDGIKIKPEAKSWPLGNFDIPVFDEVLFDEIVPPLDFISMVLDG